MNTIRYITFMRIQRTYDNLLLDNSDRQMVFLSGPRQVGKTNISKASDPKTAYFNWDIDNHRELLHAGPTQVAKALGLEEIRKEPQKIVFDEIHKYSRWKQFLKGFFDAYQDQTRIIVTGSSRLDSYKKGGDSLMGRYFPYRIHPFSVAELVQRQAPENLYAFPKKIPKEKWESLNRFGGFPEPWLKNSRAFHNKWMALRSDLLFHQDIRDLTRIYELSQIQLLATLLVNRCGSGINYSDLAKSVRVSVDTVIRWVDVLSSLYFCFQIRPWSKNVSKSLLKEPKIYLWDWSVLLDQGARHENMIASHLLKYVHWMEDNGKGKFALHFIRDKMGNEVDFVVSQGNNPFMLVEVKSSKQALSPQLVRFAKTLGVRHAFQVTIDMPYVDQDCFSEKRPVIVPATTFLSQLV